MDWTSSLVPFKITVCGLDELPDFARHSVSHVLSILDPGMPAPDAFSSYPAHARLDLRFHDYIRPHEGMTVPERSDVDMILAFGRDLVAAKAPGHLLVHCHMGVSRSSASMLLLLAQARPDLTAEALTAELVRIRPQAWPNLRIVNFGDELLGRGGRLATAVHAIYGERLKARPELADAFRHSGRGEEVERGLVASLTKR